MKVTDQSKQCFFYSFVVLEFSMTGRNPDNPFPLAFSAIKLYLFSTTSLKYEYWRLKNIFKNVWFMTGCTITFFKATVALSFKECFWIQLLRPSQMLKLFQRFWMWYADGSIHITDNLKHVYISLCCTCSKEIQIVKEDVILLTIVNSANWHLT